MFGVYKLISGEYVIGDVQEQDNKFLLFIKSPLSIHFMPSPDGKMKINMFEFDPFAKKDSVIQISAQHVLFKCNEFPEDLKKEYIRVTSGLLV